MLRVGSASAVCTTLANEGVGWVADGDSVAVGTLLQPHALLLQADSRTAIARIAASRMIIVRGMRAGLGERRFGERDARLGQHGVVDVALVEDAHPVAD